jgi:hypothetical protein
MQNDTSITRSMPKQRLGKIIKDKTAAMIVVAIAAFAITNGLLCESFTAKAQKPVVHKELSSSLRERIKSTYSKLPVSFVENRGQTDKQVRFVAQGSDYAFFLTRNEVVLSLTNRAHKSPLQKTSYDAHVIPAKASNVSREESLAAGVALDLQFVRANPNVSVEGSELASSKANYLRGNDPAQWRTDLPRYGEVVYRELWPGIDLHVSEKNGALKYEFHVSPGGDVGKVRLAYHGANSLRLDSLGALQIVTDIGTLRDEAPVSFQEIDGVRHPIQSRYTLASGTSNQYGFAINPSYLRDHELIIDPGVDYSTFLGGSNTDGASGIAVDAAGNAYIVGTTYSSDFPTTAGAFDRTLAPPNDVTVSKLNPTGTALVWSTYMGGTPTALPAGNGSDPWEFGRAIAIDGSGNVYVTGQTTSSNFPITKGAFRTTLHVNPFDATDAFVTKLNPSGSQLIYSTFLGGSGLDDALAITVDNTGSAYVTGETGSADFPVTPGAPQTKFVGSGSQAYVTKLNPAGSALVYSTLLGGSNVQMGDRVVVDAAHNAYVMGVTSSPDFPTTAGAFDRTLAGSFDIFVSKLNPAGTALLYSTYIGGAEMEIGGGLAVDPAGNAYLTGGTDSSDFPATPGTLQIVADPNNTGFVTKLNATGSALIYSTLLQGQAMAIALTPTGNAWVTGATTSLNFPTTPDAYQRFFHAGGTYVSADGFITELNATGSTVFYSTYLGGINTDVGYDIGLDSAGNVYVAGSTTSPDFPVTPTAFGRVFKGNPDLFWGDGFVTKLALNAGPPPPPALPTVAQVTPAAINVVGSNPVDVTVILSNGAQGTGAIVSLTSSNPNSLNVPGMVVVPANALSVTFSAMTSFVAVNTPVTITASYNDSSKGGMLTVIPEPPPAILAGLNLVPNVVTGGDTIQAFASLSGVAPAGGLTVFLSTNNPIAAVPASVTVPAGQTGTPFFPIPVGAVTSTTGLTIFATAGSSTQLATLTVNPKTPPVTTSTLTVSASGRKGERIASAPAGINVTVGGSAQASFTPGTKISLSVASGRDAIWSGACSSGGQKTKTCSFTLSGSASATANVQ